MVVPVAPQKSIRQLSHVTGSADICIDADHWQVRILWRCICCLLICLDITLPVMCRSGSNCHAALSSGHSVGHQQQQQYYAAAVVNPWPSTDAGSSSPQPQLPAATSPQRSTAAASAVNPAAPKIPAPAVGLLTGTLSLGAGRLLHVHLPFGALFCYMGLMAVAARTSDWYLDVACFGVLWAGIWALCCR